MIVVADSGSTKTDWRIIGENQKEVAQLKTRGFNPYFHTTNFIFGELEGPFKLLDVNLKDVKEVHYYGAGCSSPMKNKVVEDALSKIFENAIVSIYHDLLGAARALHGNEEGIACILGTGSNSCHWDGKKIIENIPSHGFLFGDEGSGSFLGKELIQLYLNGQLPKHIEDDFLSEFDVNEDIILKKVYREENPNVYLASFASFYSRHTDSDLLRAIMKKGFRLYFERRVLPYASSKHLKIHFVGSIAYFFKDVLQEVASEYKLTVGEVDRCPVDKLVRFHASPILNIY